MSIIGSSNFSYRSNRRDQEVQLYMAPSAQALEFKRRLHNEANGLFQHGKEMDVEALKDKSGEQ